MTLPIGSRKLDPSSYSYEGLLAQLGKDEILWGMYVNLRLSQSQAAPLPTRQDFVDLLNARLANIDNVTFWAVPLHAHGSVTAPETSHRHSVALLWHQFQNWLAGHRSHPKKH